MANENINDFSGQYAFLSNFYPSPILVGGRVYPTVEHYYQSQKAQDANEAFPISMARTPGLAKRMGKSIRVRDDWDTVRDVVMRTALKSKFKRGTSLAAMLVDTGDATLVEGNTWHDNYWGDCHCPACSTITGKNKLGKMLMDIRDKLSAI